MNSTTLRCTWRTSRRGLTVWSTPPIRRPLRRTISTSAMPPSCSSAPAPHLFENPAIREFKYDFFPEAVLSHQADAWAESTINTLDHPRDQRSAFFNFSTATCNLCGSTLAGSYSLHRCSVDHTSRLGVVKRALGFFYTFYSQVHSTDPAKSSSVPSSSSLSRSRNCAATTAAASRHAAAQSCYHTTYSKSFLFEEDGVPSHELLHHRYQSLRELDLVDVLLKRWWRTLNHVPVGKGNYSFGRILSLSAENIQTRLHRLRYLLFFLASRGVLRDSMAVAPRGDGSRSITPISNLHRTEAFERYEMIGDLEFKNVVPDRAHVLFPADEGGIADSMAELGRVLDSNHGLLAIYDYLNLDQLFSLSLSNNKSKSDVVEALMGELRAMLWSSEVVYNTDAFTVPGERATTVYLRSLVEHTLYEMGHVALMWRIDSTLRNTADIIMGCLEKEFPAHKRARRYQNGASTTEEAELSAKAPRNALQPLLLPWERRHSGLLSLKDEAEFSMLRRPARPAHVFQSKLQHLSSSPCEQSAEQRRQFSVPHVWNTALVEERMRADVAAPLVLASCVDSILCTESDGCGNDAVVLPSSVLDLQQTPTPNLRPEPSTEEKRNLLRENCVILLDPLPLPGAV